ncbi:MAG: nonstructural protein [Microvirus sp.]|nr:MAG: nonstructural protein [Microvirus sp.]
MFGKKPENKPDVHLFSIYDTKVGVYSMPTEAMNEHDIVRQFTNLFEDGRQAQTKYFVNAEDFQIFRIGYFDRHGGEIISQKPEHIANLHELKTLALQKTPPAPAQLGIVPT